MGKIALCLSGLAHDLDYYFPITKSGTLDRLKPDIFIGVWENDYSGCWQSEHQKAIELFKPINYHTEFQKIIDHPIYPRTELCDKFMAVYPRKERWENFRKGYPDEKKIKTYWGRQNVLNLTYMIWQANRLKSEYETVRGFKYDVVIRARIDRGWEVNHSLKTKPGTIFLHSLKHEALSNWFAYGSSKDMDTYSTLYPNLLNLAEQQEDYSVFPDTHVQAWYKWLDIHRTLQLHLENEKLEWEKIARPNLRGHGIHHTVGIS